MKTNISKAIGLGAVTLIWLGLSVFAFVKPASDASVSERRKLAQFPEISAESVLSGKFMKDFETYTLDQFPFRDDFRTLKSYSSFYAFGKKDNNGIYLNEGYASKLEYPLDESAIENAADKFTQLYDKYIKDSGAETYLSVIPDKNYFMAKQNGYPALDYDKLLTLIKEGTSFAQYIDIFPTLSLDDYYKTDTHWRQECITDAASAITSAMGAESIGEYTQKTADVDFYGVYYGQSALPLKSEKIHYLSNDVLDSVKVTNAENGKKYDGFIDVNKINSNDPYEIFLSGAAAIVYMENPQNTSGRELVMFRDSFGSSIAPLLLQSYSKITLVDTRYIVPDYVGNFVEFSDNTDVLFLYSTLILNQSRILR